MTSALHLSAQTAPPRRGEHVHHASHRLGSIKRGERAAHHLHLLHAGGGEASPVVAREVGIVDGDAVPHHKRLRGGRSASEKRCRFSRGTTAADGQSGNFTETLVMWNGIPIN